jgi:hypothetical protein
VVPVLTAARAEALAVRFAEGSGWQGEQHLLAHDILEQKTALFIIPDFRLVRGNCVLARRRIDPHGPKDEVKVTRKGLGNRLHAAGAQDFEITLVVGTLADIFAILDGAGSDRLGDLKGLVEELDRGNEHVLRVGLCFGRVK